MTPTGPPVASVVVPAHNEEHGLRRNLTTLLDGVPDGALDVLVVCNGCTDATAAVARSVPGVRVIEVPEASKALAVAVGNHATDVFPRVHLDADVTLDGRSVLRLAAALTGGVHAVAPVCEMPTAASSWPVRSFYRVWQALPHVQDGLFGRGVVALSAEGQARVAALPPLMNDDLAMSQAFGVEERRIVSEARVVVRPPRTVADLVRRRTRVATGNAQYDGAGGGRSATTWQALLRLALRDPLTGLHIPTFIAIALRSRWGARSAVRAADFTTWLRDESSRA